MYKIKDMIFELTDENIINIILEIIVIKLRTLVCNFFKKTYIVTVNEKNIKTKVLIKSLL